MKIGNIAMALDCSVGEINDMLNGYGLVSYRQTGKKSPEGYNYFLSPITEIAQFFCDGYKEGIEVYEVDWHVDKLLKLKEFQAYVNATIEE